MKKYLVLLAAASTLTLAACIDEEKETSNADPFEPQSLAFAARLKSKGVKVDEFFFPKDYKPALPHVFQFDLESDAARFTLLRALLFLGSVTKPR